MTTDTFKGQGGVIHFVSPAAGRAHAVASQLFNEFDDIAQGAAVAHPKLIAAEAYAGDLGGISANAIFDGAAKERGGPAK